MAANAARENDNPPTLADLIAEHVAFALEGCPDDVEPRDFIDAPDFEAWTVDHDVVTIESVSHSLGWLRGAAEALDMTIGALCDDNDVTIPTLRQMRRARRT